MTEHNRKVFDRMIGELENRRLKLFRSAAQLDETIRALQIDINTYESDRAIDTCIAARANFRSSYLYSEEIDHDEETEEIFKAALGDFKIQD